MLQANAKFKKWMKKPFPLYTEMRELTGESTARGDNILPLIKKGKKDDNGRKSSGKDKAKPAAKDKKDLDDAAKDDEVCSILPLCFAHCVVLQVAPSAGKRSRTASTEGDAANATDSESSEDEVRTPPSLLALTWT